MASQRGRTISLKNISRTNIGLPKGTTQADRIPDILPDTIPGVPHLLKGLSDFPNWDFQVRQVLQHIGLQDLVDPDLPHPKEDHENYAGWHNYSQRLQIWLIGQISNEVLSKFRLSVDKKDFADEAYKAIKKAILGRGIVGRQNVVYNLVKKTRDDCSTARQYVEDFKNNYILAKELQCGIPPFTASLLMLWEIRPDFPTWVECVECAMPDDAGSTYTDNDFFTLCRNAVEQSERCL
ncbi:hypothetical protein AbraIFM66950_004358 [Aspergillus brasiliensis]|nr:hypothetical protein AbraIFM66950_004358 [Aspergillus brasiliensis]